MPRSSELVMYEDTDLQEKHSALFRLSESRPWESVLPPGIEELEFQDVLAAFRAALGIDSVFVGLSLFNYVDPYQVTDGGRKNLPSATVCPSTVSQLQSILAIANKYKVPLWTISRGKNLGYGGPSPIITGSVVLDLHLMNRILEVNDKLGYCVVEPGVTFFDLYNHCKQNKLKVWPSIPSLGWGSVLGNTLDRGFGYTPLGDHHNNMCGLEIVLSNGEVIRTGQFAISNSQTSHSSKLSFGPSIEGLFLQSNLGVVTKLGMWMTPQPPAFMSCTLDMDEEDDIELIVDILSDLRRQDILQNNPVIRNIVAWASSLGKRETYWKEDSAIPAHILRDIQKKTNMGFWMCKFGFYGPRELVEQRFATTKKIIAEKAPKARLIGLLHEGENGQLLDPESIPASLGGGGMVGVPDMWTLPSVGFRVPSTGGIAAHTDFSPILPASGKEVLSWFKIAKKIIEAEGFDAYCGGHLYGRHMILINMFTFNKANPKECKAVQTIFKNLVTEGKKHGITKYRSHINDMDIIADMYDFNNHAYRRFLEKLKDELDPVGILSPGKSGIWPKRFRLMRGHVNKL